MKSIYRNEQSKKAVWKLYDRQMEDLKIPYKDLFYLLILPLEKRM